MSANHPKNKKSEAPCAHLDLERENQFIISIPLEML